ncbi:Uncharacterised protein [Streptococcus pneumoniae]|nr:Uncharacterised protein [Streptococcus pneumoniae]
MLLPTSSTPEAPKAFNPGTSTLALSFTSTLKRVIHASKCLILSLPPIASNTSNGNLATLESLTSCSLSSLPGVFKLNLRIAKSNKK